MSTFGILWDISLIQVNIAVELYEYIPMKPTVLFCEVTENFLDKHLEIMDGFTNSFIFTCVLNTLKHYSKTEKYFFY